MTAKQFYDTEIAAGVPEADMIADLNDMQANEDKALLAEFGGTFTTGNVSTWESAITIDTDGGRRAQLGPTRCSTVRSTSAAARP